MANSILHAGIPFPIQNSYYTIAIPFLDADGDPVDPTSPDTEVSKDGGAFADCTNEVTTITGGNGVGYITLTATEMSAGLVVVAAKSANAKTTILTLNPCASSTVGIFALTAVAGVGQFTIDAAVFNTQIGTDYQPGGLWVRIGDGAGAGQARPMSFYNNATGEIAVWPALETAPAIGDSVQMFFPLGLGTIKNDVGALFGGFAR